MVTLLTTAVIGRTSTPDSITARNGTWPGRGEPRAPTIAAAVGEPLRANTRLMWLPSGLVPAHASPMRPSSSSSVNFICASFPSGELENGADRGAAADQLQRFRGFGQRHAMRDQAVESEAPFCIELEDART